MHTRFPDQASAEYGNQSSRTCLEHTAMSQHRDLDVTKRDRFELLSAYLDGEVTPEERRLVTTWLDEDPETQCLYQRLLHLRQGLRGIYHERSATNPQATAQAVVTKLNRRLRLTYMAGMTAAAVAVLGVFSGALNNPFGRTSVMQSSTSQESLKIALDQPPITIPKPTLLDGVTPLVDSAMPDNEMGTVEQAL